MVLFGRATESKEKSEKTTELSFKMESTRAKENARSTEQALAKPIGLAYVRFFGFVGVEWSRVA